MSEDLNARMGDIFPVDQKTCLEALKKATLCPGVPFASIYTMRLLVMSFFRDHEAASAVADQQLGELYVDRDDEEIVEGEHEETLSLSLREEDFTRGSNTEVIEPPARCTIIHADEILGPQKVRCD